MRGKGRDLKVPACCFVSRSSRRCYIGVSLVVLVDLVQLNLVGLWQGFFS